MNPDPSSTSNARTHRQHEAAHGVQSLLWLAAGTAWAIVAIRAWAQSKKLEARRRTFTVSNRLLDQVFPNGIRQP